MTTEPKHTPTPDMVMRGLLNARQIAAEAHATPLALAEIDGAIERARACVNACAGIPTHQLQDANLAQVIACAQQIAKDGPKKKPHPYASDIMRRRWEWFERFRTVLAPFQKDQS